MDKRAEGDIAEPSISAIIRLLIQVVWIKFSRSKNRLSFGEGRSAELEATRAYVANQPPPTSPQETMLAKAAHLGRRIAKLAFKPFKLYTTGLEPRKAARRDVRQRFRQRMDRFDEIWPRTGANTIIRRAFRRHQLRVIAINRFEDLTVPAVVQLGMLPIVIALLMLTVNRVAPLERLPDVAPRDAIAVHLLMLLLAIGVCTIIIGPVHVMRDLPRPLRPRIRTRIGWTVLSTLAIAACGLMARHQGASDPFIRYLSYSATIPTVVAMLATTVAFTILLTIDALLVQRRARRYPDAIAICSLFAVMDDLRNDRRGWQDASCRACLLGHIEEAANAIDYGFPQLMRAASREKVDLQVATEVAASIRSLRLWIATPMADTYFRLQERLRADIELMLLGEWDGLLRHRAEVDLRPSHITRLTSSLGAAAVGCLPLAILWTMQRTSLALAGDALKYATIIALFWAAATIVLLFDPLFSVKASVLKVVAQLFPFNVKGK
jgi:hypothetical protein